MFVRERSNLVGQQAWLGLVAALAIVVCSPEVGRATMLNWPTSGWTAGSPDPGETYSQTFTVVDPNDVTVSVNNNGNSSTGATWQPSYPDMNSTKLTGGLSGVNALQLFVSAQSSTSSYIETTVTFAAPVTNLSFQIWDVDAKPGQFIDKIFNVQAVTPGNGVVGADSITSEVAGYNTISGSGLATVILGTATASDTTNQGTIDIVFSGPITQFSFDWSNDDSGLGAQAIGLGPLTYTIVPEPAVPWCSAVVCLAALITHWRFHRRKRAIAERGNKQA